MLKFLTTVGSFLFGGKSADAGQVIEKLDEAVLSKQERFEMDAKDMESVRAYLNTPAGPGLISQIIDSVNRSVRPVMTYWAMGCLIGWWSSPALESVSPFMQSLIYLIVTFWFGGRVVMQDVPKMLGALSDLKKKISK